MRVGITITKTLEGQVEIDAESRAAALRKADDLYNKEGRELPDMEDVGPLSFWFTDEPNYEKQPLMQFIEKEVPFRLQEVLGLDAPETVVSQIIDSLKDNTHVMFDYERLDEWISDKFDEFMQEYMAQKPAQDITASREVKKPLPDSLSVQLTFDRDEMRQLEETTGIAISNAEDLSQAARMAIEKYAETYERANRFSINSPLQSKIQSAMSRAGGNSQLAAGIMHSTPDQNR